MSKYTVKVKQTHEVSYDDVCELLVDFLEKEYDALNEQLALFERQYDEEPRDYIRGDIQDTKKVMTGIEAVIDYYRIP